jgi:hypothetical protein
VRRDEGKNKEREEVGCHVDGEEREGTAEKDEQGKEEVEKINCCEFGRGRENGLNATNKAGREHR